MDNLTTMFTDVNDKVGTIAGEVGRTPSSWNSGVFSMIENLSENVMIPIAGMIISAILCYELITMVMDKNNMHEVGSEFFFRYLIKACIAVLLLSYTFDITMAIFDVGNHIVTRAGGIVSGSTTIDVTDTLKTMFDSQIDTMGIGELIGLGIETMIVSLCIEDMVRELVQTYHSISDDQKSLFGTMQEVLGKCPKCGSDVVKGKFGAYCKQKCGMNVGRAMGATFSDTQMKSLLEGKKTLVRGLKGKKGSYDAYLIPEGIEDYSYIKDGKEIKGSQYKFKMEFPPRKSK